MVNIRIFYSKLFFEKILILFLLNIFVQNVQQKVKLLKQMTDPTQFIVQQQNIHKVLVHQGLLGKGRDFITGRACSLHLYNDRFKKTYVMQQYEGVDQNFASEKMTRITKSVHSNFVSNLTRVCFVSTRKNAKGLFDVCIFYDATGVYGYSLEYIIKMKVKNEEKFTQQEIIGFFWQICDYFLLNGQYTGEYLQITPVNIFCKADDYHGYNFFPNNFGLNFDKTKWQRKYHNPKDRFWNGEKNLQSALRTSMFTFGMVLLQLCSLLPPSDLYTDKQINDKSIKKRIQTIKLTNNQNICNVIKGLLNLNQDERITIKQIYDNKQLLKSRKVDHFINKIGFFQFKSFEGLVSYDRKQAVGEGLDEKMCFQRGKFQDGKLDGLGLKQKDDLQVYIGVFEKGDFNQGLVVRKNDCIMILSEEELGSQRGFMLKLNIGMLKADKKSVVAFEGQFEDRKLRHGKVYYNDGTQEQI